MDKDFRTAARLQRLEYWKRAIDHSFNGTRPPQIFEDALKYKPKRLN